LISVSLYYYDFFSAENAEKIFVIMLNYLKHESLIISKKKILNAKDKTPHYFILFGGQQ